jgi:hypothetical protein
VPDPPATRPAIAAVDCAFNSQVTIGSAEFEKVIIIDLSQHRIEIKYDRLRHGRCICGGWRAAHQFSPFRKVSVDAVIITET